MKKKNKNRQNSLAFYLPEDNYYQLIGAGNWKINELPKELEQQFVRPICLDKTIGVFASGVGPHLTGICDVIGGFDWLRLEENPVPGEPAINVNHFIIGRYDGTGIPVYGPYNEGSRIPHWAQEEDIQKYYIEN